MQYLESIDIKLSVEEGERKQILRILCFPPTSPVKPT